MIPFRSDIGLPSRHIVSSSTISTILKDAKDQFPRLESLYQDMENYLTLPFSTTTFSKSKNILQTVLRLPLKRIDK